MISEKVIEKHAANFKNRVLQSKRIYLQTANGKKLGDYNKVVNVNVEIQNKKINHNFIIVSNMKLDVIIGNDFLSENKAIVNLESRELHINNSSLEFYEVNDDKEFQKENIINNLFKSKNVPDLHEMNKVNESPLEEEQKPIICDSKHLNKVIDILLKHKNLFNKTTRVTNVYQHELIVNEMAPYNAKTYPIPFAYRKQVAEEIKAMLSQGIIERSKTNFINPVVIVKKKDNSIRLCLDARKINQITSPIYDKPVNIESIIGRLKTNYIYSKLDLKNSFWLIRLKEKSRKFTGFSIEGNIYQFCVVPFGLQSSSAALIRTLQGILNKYDDFCIHYIDDILIFSENEEKHYQHIAIILKVLDEACLKLKLEKCQFFEREIQYLGYVINNKGIQINQNRLDEIKNYPRPKNLRTLRGFLGILNYYKRFINNLAEKQGPLIELLRKGIRWKWDERREKTFQDLRSDFHERLLLNNPDYDQPFIVRTDSSDFSLGGELLQIQNGVEVPICFVSRILKGHEIKYSTPEKEMLSLCYTLTRLRFYLIGNHFTIETDHSALQFLMNNRFTNNRIYRWSLLLQEYQFTVKHIPGKTNITADSLSRMKECETAKPNTFLIALNIFFDIEQLYSKDQVKESQEELGELRNKIDNQNYRGYSIKNGYIIKTFEDQEVYVIDERLTKDIMTDLHIKFGHIGMRKTWKIFRENFYAKNDITIAKESINNCELCCLGKYKNHVNRNTVESITANHPNELIAIDYISNLVPGTNRCKNILVMLDVFSKFIKLYPCQSCNTNTNIILINEYYKEVGKPSKILVDNATYFHNQRFKNFCTENQIKLVFTSIRHPNSNPVERYNQEVIKMLRLYVHEKHETWVEHLKNIEFYINNVPNTITHISPILIMKNELPMRPWEIVNKIDIEKLQLQVRERVNKTACKYKQKENSKIKKRTIFKTGDLVIIKSLRVPNSKRKICAKLLLPYEGPYKIVNIFGNNTYELLDERRNIIKGRYHINIMYPYLKTIMKTIQNN